MHRNIVLGTVALTYYVVAFFGLYIFSAGLLASTLLLFAIPSYVLARYSAAPTNVLVIVSLFGAGMAILLEGIAQMYGLWYTLGVEELKLFGLVPLEVIAAYSAQMLFLVLLYEFLFDDGEYSLKEVRTRFISYGAFFVSALCLLGLHQYVLQAVFLPESYIWILAILTASTLAILATHSGLSFRFFDRLTLFTLVAVVPLSISAAVAVLNTQKIFAFTQEYIYTFSVMGNNLPLEEILLIFVTPLFVAVFYEVYLDDGITA